MKTVISAKSVKFYYWLHTYMTGKKKKKKLIALGKKLYEQKFSI